jgi:type II secretory pathway pseudopilin PulG
MIRRRRKRPAYTLLEIVLALTIAVMLLAALYGAVGYQLRQAQDGRDMTSQTTLSRSVVARIENDVVASLALSDPGRFRNQQLNAQAQQAQQQASGTSGTTGTTSQTSSTTSKTTTSKGTTAKSTTSGMTQTPSSGTTSGTTSGTGTNGSTPPPVATSADVTDDSSAIGGPSTDPVVLPSGVVGDSTTLTLFISKVPSELYNPRPSDQGQVVSDLRRIVYWVDENLGLCRQDLRLPTSDDAMTPGVERWKAR